MGSTKRCCGVHVSEASMAGHLPTDSLQRLKEGIELEGLRDELHALVAEAVSPESVDRQEAARRSYGDE